MAIKRKVHKYYNFDKLNSFNATINGVVGARGVGKTYGEKKIAINKFIKRGEQFILLRRYKDELKAARDSFFADVEHEFPNYDFKNVGNKAYVSHVNERPKGASRPWKLCGMYVALSTAQNQKGVSYHNVTTIIFDEFILDKGVTRYLDNEVNIFMNFLVTVDRFQDKTKVYMFANSVSIMCPYLREWGIVPDEGGEWFIRGNGFIAFHFPDAEEFKGSVYQTKLGQFIEGSEFAKTAVENEFADNHANLVEAKDPKDRYRFTLWGKSGTFAVWYNMYTRKYHVLQTRPKAELHYTTEQERVDENTKLILFNDLPLQQLRTAFRHARVMFDSPTTRNAFVDSIQK